MIDAANLRDIIDHDKDGNEPDREERAAAIDKEVNKLSLNP